MDDPWALLRLQIEWGADEALEAEPLDRLRPVPPTPRIAPAASATPRAAFAPAQVPKPGAALPPVERASALASAAGSLDALREALANFDGCALRNTATNLVFASGDPASDTLVIGEPPGREADRTGEPFAGPEGLLLDQMLQSLGIQRSALMLTPLIPWRPPGERTVSPQELALCLPFLYRLIGLLRPARLLAFGSGPARALLPKVPARRRSAPAWVDAHVPGTGAPLPTLPLPGLGEMLKTPMLRRNAWAGLRLFRRALDAQ